MTRRSRIWNAIRAELPQLMEEMREVSAEKTALQVRHDTLCMMTARLTSAVLDELDKLPDQTSKGTR